MVVGDHWHPASANRGPSLHLPLQPMRWDRTRTAAGVQQEDRPALDPWQRDERRKTAMLAEAQKRLWKETPSLGLSLQQRSKAKTGV
jgi:hypothetical protein